MKKDHDKLVQEVIKSINWQRIKYFHQVFGIKWQFQEKEGYIVERYPTIVDLKEELLTLLRFAISKNTPVLDYGNWLIRWNEGSTGARGAKLEAIFSLEDSVAIDLEEKESEAIDKTRFMLEEAIFNERYEEAAKLRDKIVHMTNKRKI